MEIHKTNGWDEAKGKDVAFISPCHKIRERDEEMKINLNIV